MSGDALAGGLPDGVLPCGRSTDDVLDQVVAGRADQLDAHQSSCVHCQAALSETARLWAPVRALAARVEDPPPGLVDGVMRAVRALARDAWYVVVSGERGSTRIAARVLAEIAQRAAARVPGVRAVLGRHSREPTARRTGGATRDHQPGGSAVGVVGRSATIDLAVVVAYGSSILRVAEDVRRQVSADLAAMAAVQGARVNSHVDDVLPPMA